MRTDSSVPLRCPGRWPGPARSPRPASGSSAGASQDGKEPGSSTVVQQFGGVQVPDLLLGRPAMLFRRPAVRRLRCQCPATGGCCSPSWSSRGGASCVGQRGFARCRRREEPQRRPGQAHVAEDRVLDVHHQPLRADLLPRVHLVQDAHLPGRDAGVVQFLQQRQRPRSRRRRVRRRQSPQRGCGPGRRCWRIPGRAASSPKAAAKEAHSFSLPTLICTLPSPAGNSP